VNRQRRILAGILLAVGLSLKPLPAAESAIEEMAASGVTALREERFGDARQWFVKGLAAAEVQGDAAQQGRAHFFLGLTDQQQARGESEPDRRKALFESALESYGKALTATPESAAILNNVARVQWDLGRTNAALETLSKAIESNDPRRGFYAEQYGDMLLNAGRWRDACRIYSVVAGEQPSNRVVHRKMVDACMSHGPDLLGWYLWELARNGQVIQVQDHVLAVVTDAVWTRSQREELMGLLAYCLARKKETVDEFVGSTAGTRLRELEADPNVGVGVKGVLHLYGPGPLEAARVSWWARLVSPGEEPRRGVWPFEAFLDLVRSLGDRAAAVGDRDGQERYYQFAVASKPGSPDPEALLGLANLYSERREPQKIEALLQRYQVDIFEAKGQAYTHSQTEKIYRYHMALGVIYSELDRWKSPRQIDSALFQLKRAIDTAEYLNEKASSGGGSGTVSGAAPVVVPTRLVDLLANGYEKTGQADAAVRLRFDQAERYLKQDRSDAAARVMAPLKVKLTNPQNPGNRDALPAGVGDAYRARWKSIDEQIQKKSASPGPGVGPSQQVQVGAEAKVVVGGASRVALSASEQKALETAIGKVVGGTQDVWRAKGRGASVGAFSTNAVGAEIQEVTVRGNRGQVLLRRGTNLVQVPFQVKSGTNRAAQNLRLIRP